MLMNTDSGTPGTRQARLDASTSDAQTTHEAFDAGRILIDASQKTKPKPPKPKLAPRAQFSRIFGSIFSNMHGLTKHVSNMHGLTKHVSNMHGLDLGVNLKAIVPIEPPGCQALGPTGRSPVMAKLGNLHNRNIDWVDDVFDMLALGVQVSRSANRAAQMSKLNARRLKKKLGTMNGAREALLRAYRLALFVVYQGIQSNARNRRGGRDRSRDRACRRTPGVAEGQRVHDHCQRRGKGDRREEERIFERKLA